MHAHTHSHDHHDHSHAPTDFSGLNSSFFIAVGANLAFTILEAVYGLLANSVSLLADAGHNLSDVLGLLLAWGAAFLAGKATSSAYSYGFRKTTILAAVMNSVILVFAAGFIAWESIEKFIAPSPIATDAVIIVAAIGIAVNAGTALLFMKGSADDLNMRGAFLHLAYDAAISAGVVVAAVLVMFTDWLWVDPAVGLMIVVVILAGTWGLLRDSVNLILDAVPAHINQEEVRDYLKSVAGVADVHDLHIWAMSTRENGLTAHLVMPENTLWDSEEGYASIAAELEHRFNIHHATLQVEKDRECAIDCD